LPVALLKCLFLIKIEPTSSAALKAAFEALASILPVLAAIPR